jgi:hypothetical protein
MLFESEKEIEIYCQAGLRRVGMKWRLSRNMFTKSFMEGTAEAFPTNRFAIGIKTAKLHPGFYDLRVMLDVGRDKTVDGLCTFGFKSGEMPIRDTRITQGLTGDVSTAGLQLRKGMVRFR